eukprot:8540615-Alexandrium_andersonii.AAC.1
MTSFRSPASTIESCAESAAASPSPIPRAPADDNAPCVRFSNCAPGAEAPGGPEARVGTPAGPESASGKRGKRSRAIS